MMWDEKHEAMPRADLERLQLGRLQDRLAYVYQRVSFYREAFDRKGVKPSDVRSIDDLRLVPFTTKQDFRDTYPFGLCAIPLKDTVRLHASSGTTGKPTVVAYSAGDIELWTEVMARSLTSCGTTSDDIVHNAYGYGLFTGGLGAHYGAERIGATVIPMSGGNTKRQIMLMVDFGSTVLTCTPSYAIYMAEVAREMGVKPGEIKLKAGIHGAEPWSQRMRDQIEAALSIKAYDIYGLSEIIGPGVAIECEHQCGLHIFEDHFLPEVIDSDTGEPLPDGQRGELVFTHLTKEAMPLIRYRTRDITALHHEKCACGRTMVRMDKVTGRADDMLIIRGVNVFPSQIETVLLAIEGVEPQYQIIVDRARGLDTLEVQVEVAESGFSDAIGSLEALAQRVVDEFESTLGLTVDVRLLEPHSIQRSEGKAQRVVDKRKL